MKPKGQAATDTDTPGHATWVVGTAAASGAQGSVTIGVAPEEDASPDPQETRVTEGRPSRIFTFVIHGKSTKH